jgi:hypothetical protein
LSFAPRRCWIVVVLAVVQKLFGVVEGVDAGLTTNLRSTLQLTPAHHSYLKANIWFDPIIAQPLSRSSGRCFCRAVTAQTRIALLLSL